MRFYTGIGSRETPSDICDLMTKIAQKLKAKGFTLRSGHAIGADWAFEQGAEQNSIIYLPWKSYGKKPYKNDPGRSVLGIEFCDETLWKSLCSKYITDLPMTTPNQLLLGRNVAQIIGHLPDSKPSEFVIFYAPLDNDKKILGGTRHAANLAISKKIDTYNLWKEGDKKRMENWLSSES